MLIEIYKKNAFEMEGRQTFVDFYFLLNKIELYKKLPTEYWCWALRFSMFKQFKILELETKTILGKYL